MKRYRTSKRKSATQYSKLLKNPEFATIESERNLTVKKIGRFLVDGVIVQMQAE